MTNLDGGVFGNGDELVAQGLLLTPYECRESKAEPEPVGGFSSQSRISGTEFHHLPTLRRNPLSKKSTGRPDVVPGAASDIQDNGA